MRSSLAIATTLVASTGLALAQPVPTTTLRRRPTRSMTRLRRVAQPGPDGTTPVGAEGSAAQPPADGQAQAPVPPPAEPPPQPERAPVPLTVVAPPEEPKVEKKEEHPAVHAIYDGGLKLKSDDDEYELKIQFRNQMRFESTRVLDDTMSGGAKSQFQNHFYLPRTRLQADGHMFGTANHYKLEFGLGDSGSFSFIKEVWIDRRLAPHTYFRIGQWRRPFNRSELISDFAAIFNERSIQNELAGGGRDVGIAVHNDYEKTPEGFAYAVGVFNGFSGGADRPNIPSTCTTDPVTGNVTCVNGRPTTIPSDFGPTVAVRGEWNSAKMKGLSEGDLEGGPLRYSFGLAYKVDLANFAKHTKDSWADNMSHGIEWDANVKAHGFSVDAGVVFMKLKDADWLHGVFIQPAYMVVPKHVLAGLRFAAIEEKDDRKELEVRACLNYFLHGHTMKIAGDAGFLKRTEDPVTMKTDKPDLQLRVMLQLSL